MATSEPLRLSIALDRGVSPVSGLLTAGGSRPRGFAGWTELFAALQAAIAADQHEEEADAEPV
jgi:hypothetical protein